MKTISILLFIFLAGCSRIGFDSKHSSKVISYEWMSQIAGCKAPHCEKNLFSEGSVERAPGHLTEYFTISERNTLEILLVIDASDSMNNNLIKIGHSMQGLLSSIQDKNWKMAFTTADHGDHEGSSYDRWEDYSGNKPYFGKFMNLEHNGKLLPKFILNRSVPSYSAIFRDTISRRQNDCTMPPYCQGANEQPLRALKASIERYQTEDSAIKSFFKEDTDTIVLIITDEDERSSNPNQATTAEEVIRSYKEVFRGKGKRLFGFSLSIQDQKCLEAEKKGLFVSAQVKMGNIIGRLAELTGGYNTSLCSQNYNQSLASISKFSRALTQSIALQELFYIPETVEVFLTPEQPNISWQLYGRKIIFSDDIQLGTKIEVSYRYEQ